MRRLAGSGAPVSLILAFVFPAMIAAALSLAYYGWKYADSLSGSVEAISRDVGTRAAQELARDLDTRVDEVATSLFQRLARERATIAQTAADPLMSEAPPVPPPKKLCDTPRGPVIRSYVVLGPDHNVECYAPIPRTAAERRKIEKEWTGLLGELDWKSVKPGTFNHKHGRFESGPALITYTARLGDEAKPYYVAARLDLEVVREWLNEALKSPERHDFLMAVQDKNDQDRLIAGESPTDGRFLWDQDLSKALYRWRLYVTTANAEVFRAEMQRRKALEPLLIILSTSIIAVGLGLVWLSVLAERRASHMKSDFIANVSHELKTPLSLIRMFGEMVATGRHKGEGAVKEYGAIITRESERLSHLIDNVLDFARLERGKASYHFNEGDVAEVLERALDVCRYRLEKEKVKLRTTIAPDLPPVRMDDNAMTLVILNLVDNAIKYASEGGYVDVSLGRRPGGVVVAVRDHGPGIGLEEQSRIFERFYRARNARDRNVRGSGIGLALVKHIAEAHGGRVEVESPVRESQGVRDSQGQRDGRPGCVFRVYLPAPVSDTGGPQRIDTGSNEVARA